METRTCYKSGFSFLENQVTSIPLEECVSSYLYLSFPLFPSHLSWLCTSTKSGWRGLSIQVSVTTAFSSDLKEMMVSCLAHLRLLHHLFCFSKPAPSNMVATSYMWLLTV